MNELRLRSPCGKRLHGPATLPAIVSGFSAQDPVTKEVSAAPAPTSGREVCATHVPAPSEDRCPETQYCPRSGRFCRKASRESPTPTYFCPTHSVPPSPESPHGAFPGSRRATREVCPDSLQTSGWRAGRSYHPSQPSPCRGGEPHTTGIPT